MDLLKNSQERVLLFCDDLSFDHDDTAYKSLKAALDGGIEGRPTMCCFTPPPTAATSCPGI